MKQITYILTIIFASTSLFAQKSEDIFLLRNYQHSLILKIEQQHTHRFQYQPYGAINISDLPDQNSRYLFQAQEYDHHASLILFSSRVYSPLNNRFIQPDPESQYKSPYIFTGADPVNWIDIDGNAAKPLILYGEETRTDPSQRISSATEGLQSEIDGYYYPLSDFVNGDTPMNLEEWNGNVFIESHLENDGGIASEYYMRGEKFKLKKKFSEGIYGTEEGEGYFGFVRPQSLSERLAQLTKTTGTPLKTVTFGGCEGSKAANILKKSVNKTFKRLKGIANKITFKGFQKGIYSGYMSPAAKVEFDSGLYQRPKMIERPPNRTQMFIHDDENDGVVHDYSGPEAIYDDGDGNRYPHIEREELSGFVDGETPERFAPYIDTYETTIPETRIPTVPGEL